MLTVPDVLSALQPLATLEQKANAEAYFKGALPFLGVKGPLIDACFKAHTGQLAAMPESARFAFALACFDQEAAELRHFGVLTLSREVKRLPPGWLVRMRPLVERRATNWGTADAFAGRVMRFRLPNEADRAELLTWARADSPWLRRVACVAFVNEARKGVYAEEIRVVVRGALALDHRFAQLGAGWLLRERWMAAPKEVEDFLRQSGPSMHREAVRYAVEKMPQALRSELMDSTK